MRLLQLLPFMLASIHAILALLIFSLAISDPGRRGLLPLIVYFADYPCSILIEWLRRLLHTDSLANLVVDGLVYGIIGSLWYFGIGLLVRTSIIKLLRS